MRRHRDRADLAFSLSSYPLGFSSASSRADNAVSLVCQGINCQDGCCRLCTKPSLGLGDDLDSKEYLHHQRRLQLQRSTITSMFGADQLWAEGFKGQGVRMGVFDTGIRSDHPHVKNIRCFLSLDTTEITRLLTLLRLLGPVTWLDKCNGFFDTSIASAHSHCITLATVQVHDRTAWRMCCSTKPVATRAEKLIGCMSWECKNPVQNISG